MDVFIFFTAWIVATSVMTLFSELWSLISGNEFREPVLLAHLFTKGTIENLTLGQWVMGLGIHFLFGLFFMLGYEVLWYLTGLMRSAKWSMVFGIVIGLIGILGWVIMFRLLTKPSQLNTRHYYVHLLFAHIVFSLGSYMMYEFAA